MPQEITRWLTEIRTLQQQLAAASQERDQAYKSAANWRQLYDAEARQRREEVKQLNLTVETLRTELATLKAQQRSDAPAAMNSPSVNESTDLNTIDGLRTELVKALQACDRLQQALDEERANHAETRQTLTAAIGETIDALSPNRSALAKQPGSHLEKSDNSEADD